ncbi:MAG: UbiA family prenyltransferase, partial [Stackebrandtia sp.]
MRLPALLRAGHPGPVVAVTLVGAGLAAASGRSGWQIVSVFVTVALGQFSVAWSNDAIDASRDADAGRGDKPVAAGELSRGLAFGLAVAAAAIATGTALFVGVQGIYHIIAVVVAWLYNHPLKNTMFSVLPYAVSFGLLVAYADAEPRPGMIAAGALLGAAAHFANVLPDLEDDAKTGVRGLPHRLGAFGSQVAAAVLLLGSGVLAGYRIDNFVGPVIIAVSVAFAIT